VVAAASGGVFVGLFVAALVLLHRAPHLDAPDATYTAFYAHGGDTLFVAIGLYLVPLAGIAFLWHMTAIRALLDTLTPRPSGMAHGLNLLAGTIFVTMLFAGTAAIGAVAFAVSRGGPATIDPGTARALTAVGWLLGAFLLLSVTNNPAALLVFPLWVVLVSVAALRHRAPAPAPATPTAPAAPVVEH
jgi:hypothetical protein